MRNVQRLVEEIALRLNFELQLSGPASHPRLRGGGKPVSDLVGILFVESVGELSKWMAQNYADPLFVNVENALPKIRAIHMKSARQISLRTKNRISHQFQTTTLPRRFGDVGGLSKLALKE